VFLATLAEQFGKTLQTQGVQYVFGIPGVCTQHSVQGDQSGRGFIEAAIKTGMDVVSANKGPFVLYFDALQKCGRPQ